MSIDEEENTFVIKRVFANVKSLSSKEYLLEPKERHFNIPWNIFVCNQTDKLDTFTVFLCCVKFCGTKEWSIDTTIEAKILTKTGEELIRKDRVFANSGQKNGEALKKNESLENYLVNGTMTIECHVTINKVTGIEKPMMINFNNEKFSDVVLVVKNRKFHVSKLYMAHHSKYFESLFMGTFEESKQLKIELKDIDPWDFQNFLLVLYGEPAIDEDNIEGILQLAEMYDAKAVIRQCEDFLIFKSEIDLKFKFNMALKYNMDQLQKKCISEIKSVEDIEKVFPEDDVSIDNGTLRQLLRMSIDFYKKK